MVIEEFLDVLNTNVSSKEKVKIFWDKSYSDDFTTKHLSLYTIKLLKEQFTVPLIIERLKIEKDEEIKLRLLDIMASLEEDSSVSLKWLLVDKNPYIVRGYLCTLALNGGKESLKIILDFISSNKGRLIKRELANELIGYLIKDSSNLRKFVEDEYRRNNSIRGYLRDMVINYPVYGRLSVYPSNDYFALKAILYKVDYKEFKNSINTLKKCIKSI